MSNFSGKCDWKDSLDIHNYTLEELQNNVKIYIGRSTEPLHIEKMSDMIPYYPYIVGSASFNNTERSAVIRLSSESFVDREEREILELKLKQILKTYNRCKRNKTEFKITDVVKELCWMDWNKNAITELAIRVRDKGKKATIDGIHLSMHEYYREKLVEEMINNNLNPADYGYERFIKENKNG